MKRKLDTNILLLLILGSIPLLPLLHEEIFLGHDVEAHLGRLASFYASLVEGNIVPRWGANLNAGYGHPVLMFLFPLPMYLGSLFHFLGLNFMDSLKIVFAAGFLLSGTTMYLFIKEIWGEKAAFLASLFYMFAPYRFVDLYVRGAVGENLAFIFPPLICLFLLKLKNDTKWRYVLIGAISVALLVLSHNALALMFFAFIICYTLLLLIETKNQRLNLAFNFLFVFLLGLSLSAFFWIPSLFEGKYTLRDIVINKEIVFQSFAKLDQLITPSWGYGDPREKEGFSLQIGIPQIFVSTLALFLIIKNRKKEKAQSLTVLSLVFFFLGLFLMTKTSQPVWEKVTILQKFQFPWRILSLVVFTTSIIAGYLVYPINGTKQKTITVIILTALILITTKNHWQPKGYFAKPDNYFLSEYIGTTDTGESTPRWSVRAMEEKPKSEIEVIGGKATVASLKRTSTRHEYEAVAEGVAQLRDNTLYFPGWTVSSNGKEIPIEYHDPNNRGVITFRIPSGQNNVEVVFKETKLRLFSDIISLFSLVVSITILVKEKIFSRIAHRFNDIYH